MSSRTFSGIAVLFSPIWKGFYLLEDENETMIWYHPTSRLYMSKSPCLEIKQCLCQLIRSFNGVCDLNLFACRRATDWAMKPPQSTLKLAKLSSCNTRFCDPSRLDQVSAMQLHSSVADLGLPLGRVSSLEDSDLHCGLQVVRRSNRIPYLQRKQVRVWFSLA